MLYVAGEILLWMLLAFLLGLGPLLGRGSELRLQVRDLEAQVCGFRGVAGAGRVGGRSDRLQPGDDLGVPRPRRHELLDLHASAIQLLLRGGETLLHLAVPPLSLLAGTQSPDQPAKAEAEQEGEQHPEKDFSGDVEHGSDSLDDELDAAIAGLVLWRVVGYQRVLLAAAEGGEVVGGDIPADEVVLDGVGSFLAEREVGLG